MTDLDTITNHFYSHVRTISDYLLGRGITGEMARVGRLGYVAEPPPGYEQYSGRLAIPYLSPSGVRDIRFRAIGDGEPKYLGASGKTPRLYMAHTLLAGGPVAAICEGELSALVAHYVLGIPTVGVPGVQSWGSSGHAHWPRCFAGFDRVLVLQDGDKAGRDLSNAIARDLEQAVVIPMPDGQDPDSVVLIEGADGLRERIGL